jgi:hypothetical protein
LAPNYKLIEKLLAAVTVAVTTAGPILACAVENIESFSWTAHPNLPIEPYVAGKLGIVQPTFARSYLVIAYRYLSGHPLSKAECNGASKLINHRLWDESSAEAADTSEWQAARQKVIPGTLQIATQKSLPDSLNFICNCQTPAFRKAAETLADRISKFGITDPSIKQWVLAQDIVFSNCESGERIPDPLPNTATKLQRQDRNYQIAAAYFYAGRYDRARELFQEIGKDPDSPWNVLSRYLSARSLIRRATTTGSGDFVPEELKKAKSNVDALLKDHSMDALREELEQLAHFVDDRLSPKVRIEELSQNVTQNLTAENLDEYTKVYDLITGETSDYVDRADAAAAAKKPLLNASDDLTDWIDTYQSVAPAAHEHAIKEWQTSHSLPWLIASLDKVKPSDASYHELIAAATKVQSDSPAFDTASYSTAQLLMAAKKFNDVGTILDSALAKKDLDLSSKNLFLSLRLQIDKNLNAFIKDSFAKSCGTWGGGTDEIPGEKPEDLAKQKPYLLPEARDIMNSYVPVEVLQELSLSKLYPSAIHRTIAKSVWVRAVLLENWDVASALAKDLITSDAKYASLYKAYLTSSTPGEKKFAADFQVLKDANSDPNLGDRPENEYEHWWWSRAAQDTTRSDPSQNRTDKPPIFTAPLFLTPEDVKRAQSQQAQLRKIPTAPTYLSQQIIAWAKANPNDRRVPEALHLAVRCTRYGDKDTNSSKFSKEAFIILHKQYPKSSWVNETPYYY